MNQLQQRKAYFKEIREVLAALPAADRWAPARDILPTAFLNPQMVEYEEFYNRHNPNPMSVTNFYQRLKYLVDYREGNLDFFREMAQAVEDDISTFLPPKPVDRVKLEKGYQRQRQRIQRQRQKSQRQKSQRQKSQRQRQKSQRQRQKSQRQRQKSPQRSLRSKRKSRAHRQGSPPSKRGRSQIQ